MANDEKDWYQSRSDEEFSECIKGALLETEKWIMAVTGTRFKYADDPRKSLENGVLLCELFNGLRPDTIGRINRLSSPIAGIDNLNVFLQCCNKHFGLKDSQLFAPGDFEDLSNRAFADSEEQLRTEEERRLRNVLITIFWLGRKAQERYNGPQLELTVFAPLVGNLGYLPSNYQRCPSPTSSIASSTKDTSVRTSSDYPEQRFGARAAERSSSDYPEERFGARAAERNSSDYPEERFGARAVDIVNKRTGLQHSITSEEILAESQHYRQVSSDSIDYSSAYGSFISGPKTSQSSDFVDDDGVLHSRDNSYDSLLCEGRGNVDLSAGDTSSALLITMPVRHKSSPSSNKEFHYSATFDHRDNMNTEYDGSTGSLSQSGSIDEYSRHRFSDSAPHNTSQGSIDSGGPRSPKYNAHGVALATRAPERKTSVPMYDPLQYIKGSGTSTLAQQAKVTVTTMQKQKEHKKVVQTEDADWHSNLSNWKSKMRRKSAVECKKVQVLEEVEKQFEEDSQANKKKNKTFSEIMKDRQQRKGITSTYPMEDNDSVFKTSPRTEQQDQDTLQSLKSYSQDDDDEQDPYSNETYGSGKESFQFSKTVDTGLARDNGHSDKKYGVTRQYTQPEPLEERNVRPLDRLKARSSNNTQPEPPEERQVRPLDRLKARSNNNTENRLKHDEGFGQDSLTPWADFSPTRDSNQREISPSRPTPGKLSNLSRFESATKDSKSYREPSPLRDATEGKDQTARFQNKLKMFEAKKDDASNSSVSPPRSKINTALSPMRRSGTVNAPPPTFATAQSKSTGAYWNDISTKTESSHRREIDTQNFTTYQQTAGTSSLHKQSTKIQDTNHDIPTWKEKLKTEPHDRRSRFTDVSKTTASLEETRNAIEKTIKITQNPGGNKGFGFNVTGGKESSVPITVHKVSLGSAADVCELQAGDEIVSVNGAEVANHYLESVDLVLSQAARIGQVELLVKRSISQDPLLEDSFEQEEQLRLSQSQRMFAAQRHPSMSPTPEHNEESMCEEPQRDVGLHPQVEQVQQRTESSVESELSEDSAEAREVQDRLDEARDIQHRLDEARERPDRLDEARDIQDRLDEARDRQDRLDEARDIQDRLDEEERERLDRLYGHTFEEPPRSWEVQVEPAYSPYTAQEPTVIPPQIPSQLPTQPKHFQPQRQQQQHDEEEDDDAPPPLPVAPPPMLNWNTFPGQGPANSDISFFDSGDLLPDTSMTPVKEQERDNTPVRMRRSGSIDDLDEGTQNKLETVRRRSAFLGVDVYQTEEYQKIKEEAAKDKQHRKKEEESWQKIERTDNLRPVSQILSDFREPVIPEPTWGGGLESSNKGSDDTGFNSFGTGQSKYSVDGIDLETQEDQIIANLEREERERQADMDSTPGWNTHRFEAHEVEVEARQTVELNTKPEDRLSHKYFNVDEDMKRMQRWQEEQDRLREEEAATYKQEKYEREQESLRKQHDADMRRVRQAEDEKRRQEERMLEKERKWQEEMEEKRGRMEEERQRLEHERTLMEQEKQNNALNQQDTGYQSRFPWQSLPNEVDKDRIRREEEQILAERDRENEKREWERMEAQRREKERREEERQLREEKEAELMKEKEEKLKAMEDRIAREAEQLRIERESLHAEKEQQRKKWNLQIETVSPQSKPQLQAYSTQPKYTPPTYGGGVTSYGGGVTQIVTTTTAPAYQKGQLEYVYRGADHSPPEKLKRDFEPKAESIPPRDSVPMARQMAKRQTASLPRDIVRNRNVSIERKEETLVAKSSPFGSTCSLNDPLRRATPQGGRKHFPIQAKPNIKSELLNEPPSPIPSLRGSTSSLAKANPPPSPTSRTGDGAAIQLDRRSLHQLNQVPRSRLNENWVNPDAGKKSSAPRRSEVIRQTTPTAPRRSEVIRQTTPTAQHWVVEEAERRRLAEQSGKERLQKLQSRQQQQGLMQNSDTSSQQANYHAQLPDTGSQQANYHAHAQAPAGRNYVNMNPTSEAEPYIAALRQAGVYATGSTSGSQQSLHSMRDQPVVNYNNYPRTNQSKYPAGLYNEDTGYPANYQVPPSPEMKSAYYGGTTNPRPARPIPEAIKQTLLDRVHSPKSVRYNGSPQLSLSTSQPPVTQSYAPPQSMSQPPVTQSYAPPQSMSQPPVTHAYAPPQSMSQPPITQAYAPPQSMSQAPVTQAYAPPQSMSQPPVTQAYAPPHSHHLHNLHTSNQGPASPAYAYPHQVKALSSPYHASQPYGNATQAVSGAPQPYGSTNQLYGSATLPQNNTVQPYSNSHHMYNNSPQPLNSPNQPGASGPPYNSYNGNYSNPSQAYAQYAPAKPPRTFENDAQLSAENQHIAYPNAYGSGPNTNPMYSPEPTQPPQNYKHLSPNERSASDSSESAPPLPPKSAQLLHPAEEATAEQIVAVAGHQHCAHCETELGQGAAMIIESLQLYYHVHCFRCCVCCAPLGTGERGADVRVRLNKLHCQNCYSNDEAGLKYSRV